EEIAACAATDGEEVSLYRSVVTKAVVVNGGGSHASLCPGWTRGTLRRPRGSLRASSTMGRCSRNPSVSGHRIYVHGIGEPGMMHVCLWDFSSYGCSTATREDAAAHVHCGAG